MDLSAQRPRSGASDGPYLEVLSPQEEALWVAALDEAEAAYNVKTSAQDAKNTNMEPDTQGVETPEVEHPAPTVPGAGTQASKKRGGRGRGTRGGKGKGRA